MSGVASELGVVFFQDVKRGVVKIEVRPKSKKKWKPVVKGQHWGAMVTQEMIGPHCIVENRTGTGRRGHST
jgi:hypothetical protein